MLLAAWLLSAGLSASPSSAGEPGRSREEIALTARKILDSGGFQTERPGPRTPRESSGYGIILIILFWMVASGGVVALSMLVIHALRNRRPVETVETPPELEIEPAVQEPDVALAEAELMSSGSRYLDAVRRLFEEAARMIEARERIPFPRAQTDSEYLARLSGKEAFLEAVALLARKVDLCFYGGRDCSESDWIECRDAWSRATGREAA